MKRLMIGAVVLGGTIATALTSAPAQAVQQAAVAARSYLGTSANTPFGPVQVKVQVKNGTVTSVTAVAFPHKAAHSAQISSFAIPRLQKEAVVARSARIASVSGASWTSRAFVTSLQSALLKAGIA